MCELLDADFFLALVGILVSINVGVCCLNLRLNQTSFVRSPSNMKRDMIKAQLMRVGNLGQHLCFRALALLLRSHHVLKALKVIIFVDYESEVPSFLKVSFLLF